MLEDCALAAAHDALVSLRSNPTLANRGLAVEESFPPQTRTMDSSHSLALKQSPDIKEAAIRP
jgi:hypothetical protein